MNDPAPIASIPAAWLKPMPDGYKIPLWRWIVLPATTIILKKNAGVWLSGTLELSAHEIRFTQTKLTKSASRPAESWCVPLASISNIDMKKGLVSEKVEIRYIHGITRLMSVRSSDFLAQLRQALPR